MSLRMRVLAAALVITGPLAFASGAEARILVIPHILETLGSISDTPNTFDTMMVMTYTGGQAGIPGGAGANVVLFLFNENGQVLEGQTGPICAPCSFPLTSSNRKVRQTVEDLANITAGGLNGSGARELTRGYGIITVSGADPDHVAIQAYTMNAHTSPFDLTFVNLPLRELLTGP